MTSYEVSGCIVTYNNMTTIQKTLDTLFEQTVGLNFKLYIVDNASTDSTVDFIKENYVGKYNVEVIETGKNKGFGSGHNVVLDMLTSKYHVIINPDIELKENAILKMASYMDEHEETGLLSPKICFPDGRLQILGKRNPRIKYLIASRLRDEKNPSKLLREYAMLDKDMTKPFEIQNATGCFMMLRTELFKKIGGFDENYFMYFEDCDITRTVRKTHKAVFYPDAVVCHVWGRESKKNNKLRVIQIKSMFYYFRKWGIK